MKLWIILCGLLLVTGRGLAGDGHHSVESSDAAHRDEHAPHETHAESWAVSMAPALAQQLGIVTSIAAGQQLQQRITAYGTLVAGPEQVSHVRARFAGLITSVQAEMGQAVKAGDLLAKVESNASLRRYQITAPMTGRIIQRHANTGEFTGDQVLFSIANFDTLWIELRIYPSQQPLVQPGQSVSIGLPQQRLSLPIRHSLPVVDQPYQIARIALDNRELGLAPGLPVEGQVSVAQFAVSLAVRRDAIQQHEGKAGVFVLQGELYQFTPLVLGRGDSQFVEVLCGLSNGASYVTGNSYVLKAEIAKSDAAHVH